MNENKSINDSNVNNDVTSGRVISSDVSNDITDDATTTDNTITDHSQYRNIHKRKTVRVFFLILGIVFLLLGVIGVIVPGMPTTVFILLAAWSWAKSSGRFHNWLMNHNLFGKMVRDWHEKRAMPRKAKYIAWTMMGLSCALLFYRLPAHLLWVSILTSVICLATAIWMARLPDS